MSRSLRRDLRSLEDNVLDETTIDNEIRETIRAGLTDSDPVTQRTAARVLSDVPEETVVEFYDELLAVFERGIEQDDDKQRRAAEEASRRLLSCIQTHDREPDELMALADAALEEGGPELSTAGATVLTGLIAYHNYELDSDQVDALVKHVTLLDLLVDSYPRRVDLIAPALDVLGSAASTHAPTITEETARLSLEQYLCGPHLKGRVSATKFLALLAEEDTDYVSEYHLDLITKLGDDDQVAGIAANGLRHFADGTDVESLRPLRFLDDSALVRDDASSARRITELIRAAVDAAPEWVDELPIGAIEKMYHEQSVADSYTRALMIDVLGRSAAVADSDYADPELIDEAIEVAATADQFLDQIRSIDPIEQGIAGAIVADPDSMLVPTAAAASSRLTDVGELLSVNKGFLENLEQLAEDDETTPEDIERQAARSDTLTVLVSFLSITALARAIERSPEVRSSAVETLEAADDPVDYHVVLIRALSQAEFEPDDRNERDRLEGLVSLLDHFDELDPDDRNITIFDDE
ncbi:hypothetical protein [Haloarcula sediminis]|uniref:hypothetical protein n=1 Tax=Haloarcula sediminis TaxID=3111777 RepID=UPI002D78BD55|nr:hypothetical protein [Haloarcula sp. CK38]